MGLITYQGARPLGDGHSKKVEAIWRRNRMTCSEILNLVALVVIPITAVVVGYMLQDRAEKRKDKMQVFKAVMTFRYGWSKESVEALNSIPIVFSGKCKDAKVRDCWKKYYEYLCIQKPDDMQIKQSNESLYKLLVGMAEVLGYKNSVTWEEIQNPYVPNGMVTAIKNNEFIQGGMAMIVQNMASSMSQASDWMKTQINEAQSK